MSITSALKDPTTGTVTVPAHQFGAGLMLWAQGKITRGAFLAGLAIPANAVADVDAMVAVYAALPTAVEKLAYVVLAERCAILLQGGTITPSQFRTWLGI